MTNRYMHQIEEAMRSVDKQVDDTYCKKVKVRIIRRTVDPTYFEHKIKLRETAGDQETIYKHIACYTGDRHLCFFCIGEEFGRPLQEIYDAHWRRPIAREYHAGRDMEITILKNWKKGLDAWGNQDYNNIKGSEE